MHTNRSDTQTLYTAFTWKGCVWHRLCLRSVLRTSLATCRLVTAVPVSTAPDLGAATVASWALAWAAWAAWAGWAPACWPTAACCCWVSCSFCLCSFMFSSWKQTTTDMIRSCIEDRCQGEGGRIHSFLGCLTQMVLGLIPNVLE